MTRVRLGVMIGCLLAVSASVIPLAAGGSTKTSCNGRFIGGMCTPPPVPGDVLVYSADHLNSIGANVPRLVLWPNHTSRRSLVFVLALGSPSGAPPPEYMFEINHHLIPAGNTTPVVLKFQRAGRYKARVFDRETGKTVGAWHAVFTVR